MAIQGSDLFIVSQGGQNYKLTASSLAARIQTMNGGNLFITSRGGTSSKVTATAFKEYLLGNASNVLGTDTYLIARAGANYQVTAAEIKAYTNIDAETVVISSNVNNVNVSTLFTTWGQNRNKRLVINSGVTVGSLSSGTASLTIPAGAGGGSFQVENRGSIIGAGGTANSGVGGTAMVVQNAIAMFNYGTIGGGGGGGGVGGVGGGGSYTTTEGLGAGNQVSQVQSNCDNSCNTKFGAGAFCRSNCVGVPGPFLLLICNDCARTTTVFTGGGAGGSGGRGAGSDGANQTGQAGAAGGINAGAGGTGGSGGAIGVNGDTGGTGANGNNGGGAAGAGGGAAGFYVVGGTNVNFVVAGNLLGRAG
jgi:hypothetical protein